MMGGGKYLLSATRRGSDQAPLTRLRDYIENTQGNVHVVVIYCPPAPVSLQEHHTGHKEEVLASRKLMLFLRGSAIQACKSSWDSL